MKIHKMLAINDVKHTLACIEMEIQNEINHKETTQDRKIALEWVIELLDDNFGDLEYV